MNSPPHIVLWVQDTEGWAPVVEVWAAAGFRVETRGAETEPIEAARLAADGPSVVVVDLAQDLLRGLEVVSACRRCAPRAPVVVAAPDLSVELTRTVRSSGVFYIAVHPLDPEEMREVVSNALRSIGRGRQAPTMARTRERVLVVDDDEDFAAAVRALLESEGYAVSVARSGRMALNLLSSEPPDLVVLDIMMEDDWAGYAVNQAIKWGDEYQRLRSVPIVMVSSIPMDPATRFQGAGEVGMITPDAYMTKPLDSAQFLCKVRELIEAHRPRRT